MAKLKDGTRIYGDATVDQTLTVGNIAITGNLIVQGTTTSIDTTVTRVEDPIMELGGGAAGATLTSADGKDRGILLHYYDGAAKDAFMGWSATNKEFEFGKVATESSGVITVGTYGNLRAGVFFGDGGGLSNINGANVNGDVAAANYANYAGTVTGSAQSNITSVGTLTTLTVGNSTANTQFGNGTIDAAGYISAGGDLSGNGNLTVGTSGANNSTANIYGNLNVTGKITGTIDATVGAKGTNTNVQFNDAGNINGTGGFTFNKTSNTVGIGANITLAGNTGDANIGGNLNLTSSVANVNGTDLNVYGSNSLTLQGDIGGHTKVVLDASGVNISTPATNAALTVDTNGNLSSKGTASFANGNVTIDQNGNVNASGYGSFANVYDTGLTSGQIVVPGTGGLLGGSTGLTYTSNTLSANNFATTNANIQGNITTKYNSGKLLTTDVGGNLVESNVSFSANTLTVANANVTNTTTTGNLQITNLTTQGALLFTSDVNGTVTESVGLTYSSNTLNANNFTSAGTANVANLIVTGLVGSEIPYANTGGGIVGDSTFTYTVGTGTVSANNFTANGNVTGANIISNALVGTEVVFAGTGGVLQGQSGFTFISGNGLLTANNITATNDLKSANIYDTDLNQHSVIFADMGGLLTQDSGFAYYSSNTTFTSNNASIQGQVTAGNVYANSGTVKATTLIGTIDATSNAQPNITSLGNLTVANVVGNLTAGGVKTDNLYYANGNPWDLNQAAGSDTYIQYKIGNDLAASANFTYNDTTQTLTVGGAGIANVTTVNGTTLNATTGNITNVNATNVTATTGNITNVNSTNVVATTGNITTVNSTTVNATDVTATGNVTADTKVITPRVESPDSTDLTLTIKSTHTGGNVVIIADHANGGTVEVSGAKITGLAEPTLDTDAATKYYVDHVAQGLHVHGPAAVATTTNLSAFTGISNPFVVDGYTVQDKDRVLVKDQTTHSQNGIYVYDYAAGSLTRANDSNSAAEFAGGDFCFVVHGSTQADTGWVQTQVVTTLGSDPIVFSQFSGAGSYTADENKGMHINGTVFSTKINTDTMAYDGSGNLKVADSALFVTPDIGIATGTSLHLTGNLVANNANFGGTVFSNGNITLGAGSFVNGNVNGNISGTITVTGGAGAIQFANASNALTSSANLNFNDTTDTLTVGVSGAGTVVINTLTANLVAGTLTTAAQPNITSVGTLGNLSVTSNVSAGNVLTDHLLHANGAAWDFATAAGSNHYIQFSNGVDLDASANLQFDSATNNLTVNGNIITGTGSGGNISGANVISATTVTATGDVSGSTLTGSLTTANQSNITTVGTLGSLTVTNDITSVSGTILAGNIGNSTTYLHGDGSNIANISGSNVSEVALATHVTANAQANITSVGTLTSLTVANTGGTGNVTADNVFANSGIVSGAQLYGNGINISNIAGANVSGYVPNANIANVAYAVDAGNLTGSTLSSNVTSSSLTSVGTLGSLTVTNDITSTSGKVLAGQIGNASTYLYGNGSNISGVTASSIAAGNITGDTLPSTIVHSSLTDVGTLTGLTATGTINLTSASNVALGAVGNVHITGGTSGQYLQTDGSGALSWTTVDLSMIDNGTSNVKVALNGNVTVGINGTANVINIATTGLTVTGIITATGNITGDNIISNNHVIANSTDDATSAITGAITTAGGISAQGNIYTGDALGFAHGSGNTDSAAYIKYNATAGSIDFIFN